MRAGLIDDLQVILSVAFPYAAIGPYAIGGAEVICSQIEAALPALKYRSVVVAHADSKPHGKLYGTSIPPGTITEEVRSVVEAAHQANIDRAIAENAVALVHMHGFDFAQYRVPPQMPVLVTLHLPPAWYPETIWHLPENYHLVCVSRSQRQACPERERITVVENGVELPPLSRLREEGRYVLMLSRICAEKNLHTGLDAARLAGLPVVLGGQVFPYAAHEHYFRGEIEPRLTSLGVAHQDRKHAGTEGPTARFVGPVSGQEKLRVLSRAACLLLPSLVPETSSLVAMEALAAGVPVIGMAVGAVPEIVEQGRTGFLVAPSEAAAEELAGALCRLPELSRPKCRAVAERRFPLHRMLDSYSALYQQFALPRARDTAFIEDHRVSSRGPGTHDLPAYVEDLTLEDVSEDEELARLKPEWETLWSSDAGSSPFQHPGWLLPWWRQFGRDGKLRALVLRNRSTRKLVALVPLYTYWNADIRCRQLLLLGAGTSDYLDGVWDPGATGVEDEAIRHILRLTEGVDEASLHQLRPGSRLLGAAGRADISVLDAEPTSLLEVAAELPAKIRANVGRYRRRAKMHGQLAFQVATTQEDAFAMFDSLVGLHSRRWEGRGEGGVFADSRVLAHHREALPHLLRAGILRIFRLTFLEETIGVLYGLADLEQRSGRRLYLYLIGFEESFAELSPGTILLHEVWLYARENGFSTLDLLRGGEAYKAMWGASSERTFAIQLTNSSASARSG